VIHAATSRARYGPLVRLEHVWFSLVPLLVALKVLLTPISPHDFWWHLAYGRAIIETRAIPTTDSFSFTRGGAHYFDQPWLAQVLMYLGYQFVGAAGLQLLQTCVVAGAYALLVRVAEDAGAGRRAAVLATLLAASATYDNWQIRPQTYVLPLWIAVIWLLDRWRRHGIQPWALIPLVALWSNLHGTFTLPLVLAGLVLAGETVRCWRGTGERDRGGLFRLGAIIGLSVLGSCANPHGARVWQYAFALLGNRAVKELVTEWAPPGFQTASGTLFFVILMLAVVALFFRRRQVTLTEMLALGPFLMLALSAGRNIIWFAALAAALLAPHWPAHPRRHQRYESGMINVLLLALLGLPVLLATPPLKASLDLPPRLGALLHPETPLAAVKQMERLETRPQRLFHDSGFGSYLMWTVPEQPVFIDPRIEHYPLAQWLDYINLGQGRDMEILEQRYQIDGYLVNPVSQSGLLEALRANPAWRETIQTDAASLFQPIP
jgi:hypothetical protein